MIVRKALPTDSGSVSICLLLAMNDIVLKLIGEEDLQKALAFMHYFVEKESNQYSWQNCWIVEDEGRVVAAVNIYDGAQLDRLRRPVLEYLKEKLSRHIIPEDETQSGEYYIDSLGVLPEHRCRGVATHLLRFVIDEYVISRHHTLGLLVDSDGNPGAERLYLKLGFKRVGMKVLLGKSLVHLQLAP
jgi:ribosomal protein S18 acetylase RimI-like enzyme